MRSIDSLHRRLDNLEKRLPQPDVEFQCYFADEEIPDDGQPVIVLDFGLITKTDSLEVDDDECRLTHKSAKRGRYGSKRIKGACIL